MHNEMFTETEYERRILAKFAELEADNKRLKQQALAGQKAVKAMEALIKDKEQHINSRSERLELLNTTLDQWRKGKC